jgi:hypothetical protein
MDSGGGSRARCIDSHLETHTLSQKDISEWDIVMSVSILTSKKSHAYLKEHFRLANSHGRWWWK